jgi:hypothetical protein
MQADLPHTLYSRDKKKRKGKRRGPDENYRYNPNDRAFKLQEEANKRMRERMRSSGNDVRYTIDELFNK